MCGSLQGQPVRVPGSVEIVLAVEEEGCAVDPGSQLAELVSDLVTQVTAVVANNDLIAVRASKGVRAGISHDNRVIIARVDVGGVAAAVIWVRQRLQLVTCHLTVVVESVVAVAEQLVAAGLRRQRLGHGDILVTRVR